uniref:Secreted protein n=1 Tax=Knipowitschia caucasica TaxID=637954 RepID=A0AAV2KP55_KNICA
MTSPSLALGHFLSLTSVCSAVTSDPGAQGPGTDAMFPPGAKTTNKSLIVSDLRLCLAPSSFCLQACTVWSGLAHWQPQSPWDALPLGLASASSRSFRLQRVLHMSLTFTSTESGSEERIRIFESANNANSANERGVAKDTPKTWNSATSRQNNILTVTAASGSKHEERRRDNVRKKKKKV